MPKQFIASKTNKLKDFKMDLQLFADEGGEGETTEEKGDEKEKNQQTESKTYTQEELQEQTNKKIEEALKTAQEKWEKEYKEKLEDQKKEAEKLAKMNEDEKAKHEIEKAKQELADKQKAIELRELKLTAINILSEKNLPIDLVDTLISQDIDAEKTKNNIAVFETAFKAAVEKTVNERLKGKSPKGPSSTETTTSSVEDFINIIKENQIYNQK